MERDGRNIDRSKNEAEGGDEKAVMGGARRGALGKEKGRAGRGREAKKK